MHKVYEAIHTLRFQFFKSWALTPPWKQLNESKGSPVQPTPFTYYKMDKFSQAWSHTPNPKAKYTSEIVTMTTSKDPAVN